MIKLIMDEQGDVQLSSSIAFLATYHHIIYRLAFQLASIAIGLSNWQQEQRQHWVLLSENMRFGSHAPNQPRSALLADKTAHISDSVDIKAFLTLKISFDNYGVQYTQPNSSVDSSF